MRMGNIVQINRSQTSKYFYKGNINKNSISKKRVEEKRERAKIILQKRDPSKIIKLQVPCPWILAAAAAAPLHILQQDFQVKEKTTFTLNLEEIKDIFCL